MKRRQFNLAAALSLLLCAAAAGLWVRSYFVADCVAYETPDAAFDAPRARVWVARGGFSFRRHCVLSPQTDRARQWRQQVGSKLRTGVQYGHGPATAASDPRQLVGSEGWEWMRFGNGHRIRNRYVTKITVVPQWPLAAALAALPGRWLTLWHRRRNRPDAGVPGLRLRSSRHARQLPGVRDDSTTHRGSDRVKRRMFNFAAAASLVICVGAAGLWARSLWYSDIPGLKHYSTSYQVIDVYLEMNPGQVAYKVRIKDYRGANFPRYPAVDKACWRARVRSVQVAPPLRNWAFGEFDWRCSTRPGGRDSPGMESNIGLTAPYWFHLLVAAVLPVVWNTKRCRTYRNRRLGLCPRCGSDLRETPDRCPECGTEVKQAGPAKPQPAEGAAA